MRFCISMKVPGAFLHLVLHLDQEIALRRGSRDDGEVCQGGDDALALVDALGPAASVAAVGRGAEGLEGCLVLPETHNRVSQAGAQVLRHDGLDEAAVGGHGAVDPGQPVDGFLPPAHAEVKDLV
jgi:hypothetical protein